MTKITEMKVRSPYQGKTKIFAEDKWKTDGLRKLLQIPTKSLKHCMSERHI